MHTPFYGSAKVLDPFDTRVRMRPAKTHAIQAITSGGPATAPFTIYGSAKSANDGAVYPGDFVAIGGSIDGVAVPMTFLVDKPLNSIVIVVGTLTGGTSPQISFAYAGR